jgi:hypothetical protein
MSNPFYDGKNHTVAASIGPDKSVLFVTKFEDEHGKQFRVTNPFSAKRAIAIGEALIAAGKSMEGK